MTTALCQRHDHVWIAGHFIRTVQHERTRRDRIVDRVNHKQGLLYVLQMRPQGVQSKQAIDVKMFQAAGR